MSDFKPQLFPAHAIHVSLDLETASLASNAAIVQIGCYCLIDNTPQGFNQYISIASCEEQRMDISKDTMDWWDKQDPELRNRVFGGDRNIFDVLVEWIDWINKISNNQPERVVLWGNGCGFDNVVLKNAVEKYLTWPIHYRNDKDLRTLLCLTPFDIQQSAQQYHVDNYAVTKHDAMSDAHYQHTMMRFALNYLGYAL